MNWLIGGEASVDTVKSGLVGGLVGTALASIVAATLVGVGAVSSPVGLAVAAVSGIGIV